MVDLVQVLNDMVGDIITAIPAILGAIIVIVLGYLVGTVVGKAVNRLVEKIGLEKSFDQSSVAERSLSRIGPIQCDRYVCQGLHHRYLIVFAIEILNIGGRLALSAADSRIPTAVTSGSAHHHTGSDPC